MTLRNAPDPVRQEFERIRAHLRKVVRDSPITQRDIVQRADLTQSILSGVLREGGAGCHLDRLLVILDVIGVSPEKFFGGLYNSSNAELKLQVQSLTIQVQSLTAVLVRLGFVTRKQLKIAADQYVEDFEFPANDETGEMEW